MLPYFEHTEAISNHPTNQFSFLHPKQERVGNSYSGSFRIFDNILEGIIHIPTGIKFNICSNHSQLNFCRRIITVFGVLFDKPLDIIPVNTHTTKVACFQFFRNRITNLRYSSQLRYYMALPYKSALSLINVDKVRVVPVP